MKHSSFKIEDPLSLEDGIFSDEPDSSCIYKSKYDVNTYREKAPHLSYGEKVDLIKSVFVPEKNLCFPETTTKIWVATVASLGLLFSQWGCILLLVLCFAWSWFPC